ncbi:MAG TPA: HAMP domain-containing sensor histidine kinase [Anaerolineae bacterium]|nr:HAMP domain-containing sensor histidine kinase [Anaerolineae bacterium]
MAAAFALLTATFSAAFFLTSFIFKIVGQYPSAYLSQIINSLLGIIFAGLVMLSVATFFRAEQTRVFDPIIKAMEKIASGDFNIRLDNTYTGRHPVGDLMESVNNMALELNQLENMRQEFISDVSHEIQSPLTSIRGFAQALKNDNLNTEERSHYLSIIEAESTRLSRITDDLLKLASLESEQVKFEPKPYRLDQQIRDLVLASEPQWLDKGIEMAVSLEEVYITADEDLLSQVWVNLIHNSIKFTPDGGRVSVDLHRHDGAIEFKIADTGIGISDKDQAHVFNRFYKADKSRKRSTGGSGLGLSIVQKIVEIHKGTISIESTLGAGTTFTVSLPLE